ncbi:copper chaperone PCu(A)C [Microbulbifer halophilus]|uniref:Copper chaperone PCu(A)C n=1 Tax=Microbulbifer halophilus TaxID=453963 RepID=A0ABW5E5P6_9GAMM|nr:copper chaperone PCu(A)C [Microbulbifer halophilus]MCW8128429.1 copper chaperone PCu(A)C [Microbulbifer halophilus]
MRRFYSLLATLMLVASAAANEASLRIDGYARETLPGAAMAAAYLSLHNDADEERRLLRVEIPGRVDASADLHTSEERDGVSRMRPLAGLAVPAGGEVQMAPGGVHLMLSGLKLRAGDTLPLRLHFAGGDAVDVEVPVRSLRTDTERDHHHG